MDAFAAPSIRAKPRGGGPFRIAEAVLLTLVLALSLFSVPGPPDARLDGSWQEMLIHAHAQGIQFGRDLIFTWGPWGFLCDRYHLGSLEAVPFLVWQTAGQLFIAFSLVVLTRPLPLWRRMAFAALFLGFHWLFLDTAYFVLIALIAISGMMRPQAPLLRLLGWTLVLGFLSQLKFTYLVVALAGVLASIACWAARGSWRRVAVLAGGFAAAVVAAWVAAGQNLDNLYPYVRRSIEIASGYGDAMGLDEPWRLFAWGAVLALACAAFVWSAWRRLPERAFASCACGFLGFLFLVMWKEGFTRADLVPLGGHVFGFFGGVAILAPAVTGLLFPERRWHWFDAAVLYCLLAVASFDPAYYAQGPRVAWQRFYGSAQALGRLGDLPAEWQRGYEEACAREALPRIRAAVGSATVDVYDFDTAVALLNGMNLDPRPIFQGYSAYTPSLEGWNLRFYQSARAPDFLLWSDDRIDNRYPGEDDAMLVASLPGHFVPLFPEKGYWLFKRTSPVPTSPMERSLLFRRTVRLNEEVVLPAGRGQAIWLTAGAVPTGLGRLRALLYKPAAIGISTADDQGRRSHWRILPRVAEAGFILVPTLEGWGDMASLLRGQAHSWVYSFHFEAPPGQEEFWSRVEVEVFAMPGIPLRPTMSNPWLVQLGIFDRLPISITSVAQQELFDVPEGRAMLLHAAGSIAFEVPANATRFSGAFGIRDGAFTGANRSAGVDFQLDAVWVSGRKERIWSRFLDPLGRARDRGTQHFDAVLPADRPDELILRAEPGIPEDNRWDWSYVRALRFDSPKANE